MPCSDARVAPGSGTSISVTQTRSCCMGCARDPRMRHTFGGSAHVGVLRRSGVFPFPVRCIVYTSHMTYLTGRSAASLSFARAGTAFTVSGNGLYFDWCTGLPACTAGHPQLSNVTLQFEQGALLQTKQPALATGGVWIVQVYGLYEHLSCKTHSEHHVSYRVCVSCSRRVVAGAFAWWKLVPTAAARHGQFLRAAFEGVLKHEVT